MTRVLLVEDEQKIADFVIHGLQSEGFDVVHECDGLMGLETVLHKEFDLVLLDIMLPGKPGTEVIQSMREKEIKTPVIMLTAKSELSDKLLGFQLGADDYLAKPFFMEELIARCKALLNRNQNTNTDIISVGELTLDKIVRRVNWRGRSMILSQREFTLLEYLMRSPGDLFFRLKD